MFSHAGNSILYFSQAKRNQCEKGNGEKHLLPRTSAAKCIDGTTPAFFLRRSHNTKWMVYFEGGGWCYDMKACAIRAKTPYGSSKYYPQCELQQHMKEFLSNKIDDNPLFHNWNVVHVKYCDGSSYAGERDVIFNDRKYYFRGRHNRDETIKLLLTLGMESATEVVIAGCSAGGLGIYLGLDQLAEIIQKRNPASIIRGVSFSGFFLDYSSKIPKAVGNKDDGVWNGFLDYGNSMRNLYRWMNVSAGANPSCVQYYLTEGNNDTNCIFPYYLGRHIQTPVFTIQPKYDHWQSLHILGSKENDEINRHGALLQKQIIDAFHFQNQSKHGIFIDSCNHHCFGCSAEEDTWNGPNVYSLPHRITPAGALKLWYEQSIRNSNSSMHFKHLYFQDFTFPCNNCCKCTW